MPTEMPPCYGGAIDLNFKRTNSDINNSFFSLISKILKLFAYVIMTVVFEFNTIILHELIRLQFRQNAKENKRYSCHKNWNASTKLKSADYNNIPKNQQKMFKNPLRIPNILLCVFVEMKWSASNFWHSHT